MAASTASYARAAGRLTVPALLRRALLHRRARSLAALLALTVSAAIATALLTLYGDLNTKLHREFRSFGSNVVLTGADLTPADLARVRGIAGIADRLVPYAYAVAATDRGTPVVVAGTDLAALRRLNPAWKIGSASPDAGVLLGNRAAEFVADPHRVTVHLDGRTLTFAGEVTTLETGGDEDDRIYVDAENFCTLTRTPAGTCTDPDKHPTVLEMQVPGGAAAVEAAVAQLREALPQARVEAVRQLVAGETGIVEKTRALLFGAGLLVGLTVAVCVLAVLSAAVLERRRDFALMKALGAPDRHMMLLFGLEILVVAALGTVTGYALGSGMAFAIGWWNFHTATLPRLAVLPVVAAINLAVAFAAALLPVRSLAALEPALLLKGE